MKDPYPLPFTHEVINTVARHEAYTFVNGFFGYNQISITPKIDIKLPLLLIGGLLYGLL
jgi:hypothetical protein